METLPAPVSKRPKRNFRSLLNRVHLSPRAAKMSVIVVFTVCWLVVGLVRSSVPPDGITSRGSSLVGLARYLQDGGISGRDFQSTFGPGSQLLAWLATSLTKSGSSLDAYGMITFFFCALSAILIGMFLVLCDRVSWQDSVVVYAFCFMLNLFFGLLDLQTVLVLLNAAFAHRITAAETMRQRVIWATSTGLLCFASQLVAFQLGIYAVVVIVLALIGGAILTRNASIILGMEIFVATLAVTNIMLVVFFKLTSGNYGLMFDYLNYSLEILRGNHNSMGILWQLPFRSTVVLIVAASYLVARSILVARNSDALGAALIASLILTAVIWMTTAFTSSDIPNIISAFTPLVVVLALLATNEFQSKVWLSGWALTVGALLFIWPSFNLSAPADIFEVVHGNVPILTAIENLHAPKASFEANVPAHLTSTERSNVAVLSFPSDNQIGAGIRGSFFAPVLESYTASTSWLEQYYIQALDRQRQAGLEIIYGPDTGAVTYTGGALAITRTPDIFEYLYRHFELAGNEDHEDGHYKLRELSQPRDVAIESLPFSVPHQVAESGILKLNAPSNCGVVRIRLQIDYTKNTLIFRPSGIELSLSDGDRVVWQGSIMPLEPNHSFLTYVSPLPREGFHNVFGQGPVDSVKWDKVEYRSLPADVLGSKASRIRIETMQCLDPQKFVEPASAPAMAAVQ